MKEFQTHLTREKFVIYDPVKDPSAQNSTVALSNRICVDLDNGNPDEAECFVVRTQNMHSCVRFAARIVHSFQKQGPILTRRKDFEWDKVWDSIVNDYEYAFNAERWACVYHAGKIIYEKGLHHPFLDVIEKCDHNNKKDYDYAVPMAEKRFQDAGRPVEVKHKANVALYVNFENNKGQCAIILRGPDKTTKFNFLVSPQSDSKPISIPQCLSAAAAFLEGIQLAFMTGTNVEKIRLGIIARLSKEDKQHIEAVRRLSRLTAEIANLEAELKVRYRPEKPDFMLIQADAEEIAQKMFAKKPPLPPRTKSAKNEGG